MSKKITVEELESVVKIETDFTLKTNELNTKGFCIIDDVLPLNLAEQLNSLYEDENKWEKIDQVRTGHYSHVFKFKNQYLPNENEIYSAKFNRSTNLESSHVVKEIFNTYFTKLVQQISPFPINEFDHRCYKLDKGDNYRTHIDGYAASINLIYYVNKQWRWDWGGILNVLSDENVEENTAIFPKYNRVVLLNNKVFKAPHFVSTVEQFALFPRYSIVSFNK
jgi:Rps23 Pro-64 3,4-dihydroxylase Tpa1-like proline 4-hydroxylase